MSTSLCLGESSLPPCCALLYYARGRCSWHAPLTSSRRCTQVSLCPRPRVIGLSSLIGFLLPAPSTAPTAHQITCVWCSRGLPQGHPPTVPMTHCLPETHPPYELEGDTFYDVYDVGRGHKIKTQYHILPDTWKYQEVSITSNLKLSLFCSCS